MKATPTMLLKIKGEENDTFRHATMLMKTNNLYLDSHDVDERKGG
jgi:hypothetical protein